MRLIDADALINDRETFIVIGAGDNICIDIADINKAPTIEAKPVVHGEWIYHECVSSHDGAISGYSCSNCSAFVDEEIFDMDEFHKDFCGNCGADMRGET